MVKYDKNGNLETALLNDDGTLSERIIESYDYIKLKNDFNRILEIMEINLIHHQIYKEQLKYEIDDNLEFKLFFDNNEEYCKELSRNGMNGVITYSMQYYDSSTSACQKLLAQVKNAWGYLNEVERFIIKSLEFDKPPLTNEDLEDLLSTYKNKLFIYKKSGYIKLGTSLKLGSNNLEPEKAKKDLYDYLKWYHEVNNLNK
ncbi:MAG: hypothetical protein IKQ29_02240 [Bacilli bacterium]|nr:hypothetical protein [Bacilli bacterium]